MNAKRCSTPHPYSKQLCSLAAHFQCYRSHFLLRCLEPSWSLVLLPTSLEQSTRCFTTVCMDAAASRCHHISSCAQLHGSWVCPFPFSALCPSLWYHTWPMHQPGSMRSPVDSHWKMGEWYVYPTWVSALGLLSITRNWFGDLLKHWYITTIGDLLSLGAIHGDKSMCILHCVVPTMHACQHMPQTDRWGRQE